MLKEARQKDQALPQANVVPPPVQTGGDHAELREVSPSSANTVPSAVQESLNSFAVHGASETITMTVTGTMKTPQHGDNLLFKKANAQFLYSARIYLLVPIIVLDTVTKCCQSTRRLQVTTP